MNGLKLAKVTKFIPEAHAADLLFLDDGSRVPLVPVSAPHAGTRTGVTDMAQPDKGPGGGDWDPLDSGTRDVIAVVAFYQHQPIVIGFLFPQVSQMLFADKNRRVERHASDVYTTVDDDGNVEVYHPSGTYLRIGESPGHEDLTGKDFDKKWKIDKNTDKAVHVHLKVCNAGDEVSSVDLDPDGNLTGVITKDVNLSAGEGNTTLEMTAAMLELTSNGSTLTMDAAGIRLVGARIDFN